MGDSRTKKKNNPIAASKLTEIWEKRFQHATQKAISTFYMIWIQKKKKCFSGKSSKHSVDSRAEMFKTIFFIHFLTIHKILTHKPSKKGSKTRTEDRQSEGQEEEATQRTWSPLSHHRHAHTFSIHTVEPPTSFLILLCDAVCKTNNILSCRVSSLPANLQII